MKFGLKLSDIEKINSVFSGNKNIKKVLVYGSRAKGNYKIGSDIDLTIIGNISLSELNVINTKLDDLLLPYTIDLSVFNTLKNPELIDHIKRVGQTFYEISSL